MLFDCPFLDVGLSVRPAAVGPSRLEGRRLEWKISLGVVEAVLNSDGLLEVMERGAGGAAFFNSEGCLPWFRRRVPFKEGMVFSECPVESRWRCCSNQLSIILLDPRCFGGLYRCRPSVLVVSSSKWRPKYQQNDIGDQTHASAFTQK